MCFFPLYISLLSSSSPSSPLLIPSPFSLSLSLSRLFSQSKISLQQQQKNYKISEISSIHIHRSKKKMIWLFWLLCDNFLGLFWNYLEGNTNLMPFVYQKPFSSSSSPSAPCSSLHCQPSGWGIHRFYIFDFFPPPSFFINSVLGIQFCLTERKRW